jgi:bifunctional non-homologous end joining protein LigD
MVQQRSGRRRKPTEPATKCAQSAQPALETGRSGRRSFAPRAVPAAEVGIPKTGHATVMVGERAVRVTNLDKPFWPERGYTKGDLIRHYVTVAPVLLPHIEGRAMVMKRYPHGAAGDFFFMKRAPTPRPAFIRTCAIDHGSKGVIEFPVIDDLAALIWVVNLGCIDLNPWYARCDDVDRPDWLHFDLDPGTAAFARVVEAALVLDEALRALGMETFVKTSGSKGLHVYVPIERNATQQEVWTVAKSIAQTLARRRPDLMTAEYAVAKRPAGRVLVDYNQNAWGRTLASIYSVRPTAVASVSMPVEWEELPGLAIEDFTIENVGARIAARGDLWRGLLPGDDRARFPLDRLFVNRPPASSRR